MKHRILKRLLERGIVPSETIRVLVEVVAEEIQGFIEVRPLAPTEVPKKKVSKKKVPKKRGMHE